MQGAIEMGSGGSARTAALMLALFVLPLLPGAAAGQAVDRIPEAHYTDGGAEACLRCHAGDTMVVILETAHGDQTNPQAPFGADQAGCEACHGPGSLHVSRSRGGAGYPPLARFGRGGDPVSEQLGLCLGCHENALGDHPGMSFRGSLHDTGRMTCSTCHTIHTSENVLADRDAQIKNCARCHSSQIDAHDTFEGRGILFDRLTCHDCHDVHQLMRRE
jgi:predicted CXXCH cytochrome family protein